MLFRCQVWLLERETDACICLSQHLPFAKGFFLAIGYAFNRAYEKWIGKEVA